MSIEELWNAALGNTEIVRLPIKQLITFGTTNFNYVFLAPSVVNQGDTVVRKGNMDIMPPAIHLPKHKPTFEGFDSGNEGDITSEQLVSFFYTRGISFPSLNYHNEPYEIDLYEGSVAKAEKTHLDEVRTQENVSTGVVIGAEASWQFSVILMACHMIDNYVES